MAKGANGYVIMPPSPLIGRTAVTVTPPTASTPRRYCTALSAKKKKNNEREIQEKIKMTDPVQLLLLYMTPWKNPNSIFVYLFALLYALGKISEARMDTGQ